MFAELDSAGRQWQRGLRLPGTHSGPEVAVKLRRPGHRGRDGARPGADPPGRRLVARLPVFRGVPVSEVVGQMCDAVLGQLDFAAEAET